MSSPQRRIQIPLLTNEYKKCTGGLFVPEDGTIKWKKNDNQITVYYSSDCFWHWFYYDENEPLDLSTVIRWSDTTREGEGEVSEGNVVWSNSYHVRGKFIKKRATE
jgi:hypothetical protein